MLIEAKYQSGCPLCGRIIRKGDTVVWEKGSKAYHTACPIASEPVPPPEPGIARMFIDPAYDDRDFRKGRIFSSNRQHFVPVRIWRRYYVPGGTVEVTESKGDVVCIDCRPATDGEVCDFIMDQRERAANSR